jgi:hypothetical protein
LRNVWSRVSRPSGSLPNGVIVVAAREVIDFAITIAALTRREFGRGRGKRSRVAASANPGSKQQLAPNIKSSNYLSMGRSQPPIFCNAKWVGS